MHRKQERHDHERTGEFLDLMAGFYSLIPDSVVSNYPLGSDPDPEVARHGATGTPSVTVRL